MTMKPELQVNRPHIEEVPYIWAPFFSARTITIYYTPVAYNSQYIWVSINIHNNDICLNIPNVLLVKYMDSLKDSQYSKALLLILPSPSVIGCPGSVSQ